MGPFAVPRHDAVVHSAISVRAPLRIALGGGGTDLPSHYRRHGGFVLSAAIDRHVHMRVAESVTGRFELDHLERERVDHAERVEHPILRAALSRHGSGRPVRLSSRGDVQPGTGLGSSGAYAVAAVKALSMMGNRDLTPGELAEAACRIEIEDLELTVGKQDQYAASHGGLNAFTFGTDDSVQVKRLDPGPRLREALDQRFLLLFTGASRSAAEVLAGQVRRTHDGDGELERNLIANERAGRAACSALAADDLDGFAEVMDEQWELKRRRLSHLPMEGIEQLRELALRNGGRSAMLMGAGGGGYLLVYAHDPEAVRTALEAPELAFGVDEHGCVATRE